MVLSSSSGGEARLNSYLLSSCATPRLALLSPDAEHGHQLRQCASALSTQNSSGTCTGALAPFGPLALPYMPYLGLTQMDLQMYAALAASTAATPFRSAVPVSHSALFASMPLQPSLPQGPSNNEATFEIATSKRNEQDRDFLCSPKTP